MNITKTIETGSESGPVDACWCVRLIDGVAVMAVYELFASFAEVYACGHADEYTVTDELTAALDACAIDDRVTAVVLAMHSGGGSSVRMTQAVEAARRLRDAKPLVAYCRGSMCSAAYWIACHAHAVLASSSIDRVGSVGCAWAVVDTSAAARAAGMVVHAISDTPRKVELMDGTPVSKDAIAAAEAYASSIADAFRADVARERGLTPAPDGEAGYAEPFDGRPYAAERARSLGLIDAIVPEHDLMRRVRALASEV